MGVLELIAEDTKTCAYSIFIKNIEKMNSIIFDMFNWYVSQNILDLMKEDWIMNTSFQISKPNTVQKRSKSNLLTSKFFSS